MAANRGSTHKIVTIKEVTYGTTPTTPTMLEMPIVSYTPKSTQNPLRSAQIRSHPYVDKMLQGRFMHEIGIVWELQSAVHDSLLETHFGGAITAKALKYADALKSVTLESQAGGSPTLFDQFTGFYVNKLSIACSADDTAPVRVTGSGTAKAGTLDASATLASVVTAAANNDPFVFGDASLTVNAVATDVVSGTFNLERTVDPLMIWGARVPREFIPSDVVVNGSVTLPYDTGTQSAFISGWTDAPLVATFNNVGATIFRKLTFPKTKFVDIGRSVSGRGARFQEISWEGYYDSTSATIATLTTE